MPRKTTDNRNLRRGFIPKDPGAHTPPEARPIAHDERRYTVGAKVSQLAGFITQLQESATAHSILSQPLKPRLELVPFARAGREIAARIASEERLQANSSSYYVRIVKSPLEVVLAEIINDIEDHLGFQLTDAEFPVEKLHRRTLSIEQRTKPPIKGIEVSVLLRDQPLVHGRGFLLTRAIQVTHQHLGVRQEPTGQLQNDDGIPLIAVPVLNAEVAYKASEPWFTEVQGGRPHIIDLGRLQLLEAVTP